MIRISVVTHTSLYPNRILQDLVDALQTQVTRDFLPAWGIDAHVEPSHTVASGTWGLALFDNSDQAGALGYHDLTPDGLPLGKVFAKTTLDDGGKVSVTASHELLEMLVDPDINLAAEVDDSSGNPVEFFAYEVGDPVEADNLGYAIQAPSGNFIQVSDFVYPAWFESFRAAGSTRFDHRGHVNAPLTLSPGGYISFLDLSNLAAGWQQRTAKQKPGRVRGRKPSVRSTYRLS